MEWQLQQAKQQFSEVVRRALEDGPQVVTRHGREAVVVVSAAEFKTPRRGPAKDFKRFLRSAPDLLLTGPGGGGMVEPGRGVGGWVGGPSRFLRFSARRAAPTRPTRRMQRC